MTCLILVDPVVPGAAPATPASPLLTSALAPSLALLPPPAPSGTDKASKDAEVGKYP